MKFDVNSNMNDLALLLEQKIKKYTVNDSSSVTVEKAQQIMNSILYCINGYLNSLEDEKISLIDNKYNGAEMLYNKGFNLEKQRFETAKILHNNIINEALYIDNMSYRDTIYKGLGLFFKKYDIYYSAHETPADIDYQLCIHIDNLSGVEYILQYLQQFIIENNFCKNFSIDDITALLKGYDNDYRILLLNVFEIVLTNLLGLSIIGGDIYQLSIDKVQKIQLYNILSELSIFDLQEKLSVALNDIINKLHITDEYAIIYLKKSTKQISFNIKRYYVSQCEQSMFVTCDYTKDIKNDEFNDGKMLDSKKLRELIEEIKSCRYSSDKIAMIKQNVHSLSDFVDIVDNCIWDDEYHLAFKLLDDIEIEILINQISDEVNMGTDIDDLKEWQCELLKYVKSNM